MMHHAACQQLTARRRGVSRVHSEASRTREFCFALFCLPESEVR